MSIRRTSFAVVGLLVAALSVPAAFAQDADDPDSLGVVDMAEQAFGITMPDDMAGSPLANLPPPDASAFAAMQGASGSGAEVQIAEGGAPGPGGPGEHGEHGGHGWGGGHDGKWGHGGGECGGMFKGGLGLTDDQFEKMYTIKNDSSDSIAPKKAALHQAMRKMMDALGRADQDSGQIHSLQSQIASLKADITSAELGKMVAMSQVLTPEQRTKFHSMMIRHCVMSGMMKHHGGHMGHH